MRFGVFVLLLSVASTCLAVAPTIKLPLFRSAVRGAGHIGQPAINYYAPVSIGTPGKQFKIQFDTNLNELFVPHYERFKFSPSLHYDRGYLGKESTTSKKFKSTVDIDYQQCRMSGTPYQDLISFDTAQPHQYRRFEQMFLAISNAQGGNFKPLEVDGFFGLSPAASSSKGGSMSLLRSLQKAGLIERTQFSFWFNPAHDANYGGELTLGGVDPSRYTGQIFWHPLTSNAHDKWLLNLQQVTLGGRPVSSSCQYSKCEAVISTGVGDIYGPWQDVSQIYSLLGVTGSPGHLPEIDCGRVGQLPILAFTVDGLAYALLPTNYVRKVDPNSNSRCYVAVLSQDYSSQPQWILGSHFLSAYYSVFDMDTRQVGFATMQM